MTRRAFLGGFSGVATLGATSATGQAVADGGTDLLFDGETSIVSTVRIDGKRYNIVAVENAIETASGIEVRSDGERIADSEMATRILVASAWEPQWEELPASLPGTLSGLVPPARSIRDGLGPVQARLQEVDAVIQQLRDDNLWQVATTASPTVATVGEAISILVDLTDHWFTSSQAVTERVPPLVEHIEEILAVRPEFAEVGWPAYSASAQRFPDAGIALDGLADASQSLVDEFDRLIDPVETAAGALRDISELGDPPADALEGLATAIRNVFSPLRDFAARTARADRTVNEVVNAVNERQRDLEDQWEQRQMAPARVYLPVAVASLIGLLVTMDILGGPLAIAEEEPDEPTSWESEVG